MSNSNEILNCKWIASEANRLLMQSPISESLKRTMKFSSALWQKSYTTTILTFSKLKKLNSIKIKNIIIFGENFIGIGFPKNSPHLQKVNQYMLQYQQKGRDTFRLFFYSDYLFHFG